MATMILRKHSVLLLGNIRFLAKTSVITAEEQKAFFTIFLKALHGDIQELCQYSETILSPKTNSQTAHQTLQIIRQAADAAK